MYYRKAGIFDQAISTFLNVIEQRPSRLDAHEHLEKIYEEEKEWEEAIEVQKKIQRLRRSRTRNVLAHLNTELGKSLAEKGQSSQEPWFPPPPTGARIIREESRQWIVY